MKEKSNKTLIEVLKKHGIDLTLNEEDNCLKGFYSGFNDMYSEFIDFEIIVCDNFYKLKVVPDVYFNKLDGYELFDEVNIEINDRQKIEFIVKDNKLNTLEESINLLFSKKIGVYFLSLIINNASNKY